MGPGLALLMVVPIVMAYKLNLSRSRMQATQQALNASRLASQEPESEA